MKSIYLLRHAKSSWDDVGLEDFDRPLAKRGRKAAKAMAAYLRAHGVLPAQILCSAAARTRQTLEKMEKVLGAVPTRIEKQLYLAEAPALLKRVRRLNDNLSSVMVIGHNPGMESLAQILVGNGADKPTGLAEKFPTGALAVIQLDIDHWQELKPGCGRLQEFVRPRDLLAAQ